MFICAVLLTCLSLVDLGEARGHKPTGVRYTARARRDENPPDVHGTLGGQRSSSGHARVVREIPEGGMTISTLPDNMTHLVEDPGRYYSWLSFGPEARRTDELWLDMSDARRGQVRMHGILSNTHKQAARVALSFDFPFYGHYLRQITIATGGFIFTGDVTHRMLTATQYIAPLMADFDPSFSRESTVQYHDDGEVFVVQWDRVRLKGREAEGAFTFQAALHRTGTITFSYRDIPLPVEDMRSAEHAVKAGLSDAFTVLHPSSQLPDTQRQTIYEYHRVDLDTTKITNHSAIEFTPLPTCLQYDSCELCLSSNLTSGCSWCNVLQRCSDGLDRHRQEWLDYACSEAKDVTCEDYSQGGTDSSTDPSTSEATTRWCPLQEDGTKHIVLYNGKDVKTGLSKQAGGSPHTGVIAGVVAATLLLLALTLLALYIYSHPTAVSPLYLIQRRRKYWPSMTFRKQGFHASYTEVEPEGHEKIEAMQC